MYFNGFGVPQDYAEALRWLRLSAEQGQPIAQSNLGRIYGLGLGVSQDYAEAVKWFHLSAERGDSYGQYMLAVLYAAGQGSYRIMCWPTCGPI